MQQKTDAHVFKGMQRDIDPNKQPTEYYIDAHNIRLTLDDTGGKMSITSEKFPTQQTFTVVDYDSGNYNNIITGKYLGHAVLNNYLVIFSYIESSSTGKITNYIYRIDMDTLELVRLYVGDLNMATRVKTLPNYESAYVQKVYWTDGVNQPRVINIMQAELDGTDYATVRERYTATTTPFDFVPELALNESVSITKSASSSGSFPAGIVQYALTYYNKYRQESNIAWVSPLLYTSFNDRAGSPEETIGNAFTLSFSGLDSNFEYARLYSIVRTSLDSTPTVKRVVDFSRTSYATTKTILNLNYTTANTSATSKMYIYIGKGSISDNLLTGFDEYSLVSNYTDCLNDDGTYYVFPYDDYKDYIFYDSYTKLYYTFSSSSTSNNAIYVQVTKQNSRVSLLGYDTSTYDTLGYNTIVSIISVYSISKTVTNEYEFTDDNTYGEIVDPTYLLYVGGEEITAETICQKDGTLFLGNISITRPSVSNLDIGTEDSSLSENLTCEAYGTTMLNSGGSFYPYVNTLNMVEGITGFKYGETYRLGLQFQYKNGKWSEPVYLCDSKMTKYPYYTVDDSTFTIYLPSFKYSYDLSAALNLGYKKVRAVVVIPSLAERQVIAQGVLCPTVYSVKDRELGTPYAQSSWYTRFRDNGCSDSFTSYGQVVQSNHNYTLYGGLRTGEIQGTPYGLSNIATSTIPNSDSSSSYYISYVTGVEVDSTDSTPIKVLSEDCGNIFAVDQQIVTFHSPDILWNDDMSSLDWTNMKVYYIGYINFGAGACAGDIYIQTSSPVISSEGNGFVHYTTLSTDAAYYFLNAGLFYDDYLVDDSGDSDWPVRPYSKEEHAVKYIVYPWHKSGSLNNDCTRSADTGERSALLSKKIISNIHVGGVTSGLNVYDSNETELSLADNTYIQLFNSDEVTTCKLGSNLYYGNVDTLLTPIIPYGSIFNMGSDYILTGDGISASITNDDYFGTLTSKSFRKITTDGEINSSSSSFGTSATNIGDKTATTGLRVTKDPMRMKYKSTPHLVMQLGSDLTNTTTTNTDNSTYNIYPTYTSNGTNYNYHTLIRAEIRRSSAPTFGGTDSAALQNNIWLPAGYARAIDSSGSNTTPYWRFGDTYYQRWDCLKTYAYTQEDENQIVDITSFMCESRINCDGRYDKNRGQSSNLYMSPTNFNLHNPVYNQLDNYFTYRILSDDYYKISDYPNTITWTTEKTNNSEVDPWTNVTLASTLDVDGSKGTITELVTNNNHIYCFQDRAISEIQFNSRTQINTTDGVPIEISNNYKVDGVNYLTENIGSDFKWNICNTPGGVYFIDSQNKELYSIGSSNGLVAVSAQHNMSSWFKSLDDTENYLYYDFVNNDLYVQSADEVLNYSETMGEFISFFDYCNAFEAMFSIEGGLYGLTNYGNFQYLYRLRDKNFGATKVNTTYYDFNVGNSTGYSAEYDISFISNSEAATEKIFSNINVRGDWYSDEEIEHNTTFTSLQVSNEYQDTGTVALSYNSSSHSANTVKKKFRIWRFNIPRNSGSRDRIANMWAKVKLTSTSPMKIHDLDVQYYVR